MCLCFVFCCVIDLEGTSSEERGRGVEQKGEKKGSWDFEQKFGEGVMEGRGRESERRGKGGRGELLSVLEGNALEVAPSSPSDDVLPAQGDPP
jgi:hypothetical protein